MAEGRGGRRGRGRGNRGGSRGRGRGGRGRGRGGAQGAANSSRDASEEKTGSVKETSSSGLNLSAAAFVPSSAKGSSSAAPRKDEKKQRQRKDGKVDKPPGLGRSKPKGGKAKESKQRNEGGRKSGNSRPPANGTAAADGVDVANISLNEESTTYPRYQSQMPRYSIDKVARTVPNNANVLCVAEKPSLAQSIAIFLAGGKGNLRTRKSFQDVHEFEADFLGKRASYRVTSVIGHVYSLDFKLPRHKSWDVDPSELFEAPTERTEANPKAHIAKHLRQEAKGCQYLLLWLDCDREGENICFEVIENALPQMRTQGIDFPVLRAKFSAITHQAIHTAMRGLTLPNENEAAAVDARQELDLKVGVTFTRFQTRYFQGKYSNLDASVISYGPCQTPTLGFCVERHLERLHHVPKPFWTLQVEAKDRGEIFNLNWAGGRVFEQKKAVRVKAAMLTAGIATVVAVEEKQGSTPRPTGLNTVGMLKLASTVLGMGPHHAMQVAERLYMQGFLSYPRTESTGYPKGFDMEGMLGIQSKNRYWGNYVKSLIEIGFSPPRQGKDMGDHPPLTPTQSCTEVDIGGGDSWRLYDLVARHFIASVSPDSTHITTKIEMECAGERLVLTGRRPLKPGFTAVLHHAGVESTPVPALRRGDSVQLADVSVSQGETSPPGHLTESELIERMEKNGIGTDASIPTHINNITVRRYCNTSESRTMVPTTLGLLLVQGYKRIDRELVEPAVRSYVERQIDEIAKGRVSLAAVLRTALGNFRTKFQNFVSQIKEMDSLFEASFTGAQTSKIYTRCGKTMRYLKIINSRPPRLYNPLTEDLYIMPLGGSIVPYKSLTCPLCNFELSLYKLGQKSYPLCPNCYCNPPDGMREPEEGVCGFCPMDDSHPIVQRLAVCDCPESEGKLIVDPTGGPNWKLVSTRSPLVACFPPGINKVTVLQESDESGSRLLEVDFNERKFSGKVPGGGLKHVGSLADPFVEGLLEYKHGKDGVQLGRRRGRGRGRRGRGRGRMNQHDLKMSFYGF